MFTATRGGANELEAIQERYMNCLKTYVEYTAPNQPSRFHELLLCLPEVRYNMNYNIHSSSGQCSACIGFKLHMVSELLL